MNKSFQYGFRIFEAVLHTNNYVTIYDDSLPRMWVKVYYVKHWEAWVEQRLGGFVRYDDWEAQNRVIDRAITMFQEENPAPQLKESAPIVFHSFMSLFDRLAVTYSRFESPRYDEDYRLRVENWKATALLLNGENETLHEKIKELESYIETLEDLGTWARPISKDATDEIFRKRVILEARAARMGELSIRPTQLSEEELAEYVTLCKMFAAGDFYSEVDLSVPHPVEEAHEFTCDRCGNIFPIKKELRLHKDGNDFTLCENCYQLETSGE